jgi:two-component system response regulator YesN
MFSLLIVEDESWVREQLRTSIPWQQIGISRLFTAINGMEALNILRTEAVDFVLTDIRMPLLTGLELLKAAKQEMSEVEFVMLTGFDDFEYARTAMRYGAYDYLLKPARDEELLHLFSSLIQKRNLMKVEQTNRAIEQITLKQSRDILREKFLAEWFGGKLKDPTLIRQRQQDVGANWDDDSYVVMVVDIDNLYHLTQHFSLRDLELLKYAVRNILEEHLQQKQWRYYTFAVDERLAVWCEINPALGQEKLENVLEKVRHNVKELIKVTVSLGISLAYASLDEVEKAYMEAVHSLKMKLYLGTDQAFFFAENHFQEDSALFQQQLRERFSHCMSNGNIADTEHLLSSIFQEMQTKKIPPKQLRHVLTALLNIIWESASHLEQSGQQMDYSPESQLQRLEQMDTLEDIYRYVAALFERVLKELAAQRSNKKSKLIIDILRFMEDNYNQDIMLQSVAERFYVNPSYLSRLFKEEVGDIFTKYTMELRMKKAKTLLKNTHLKIYEISQEVGYDDVKYFNKIFKRFIGLTPAGYRNEAD